MKPLRRSGTTFAGTVEVFDLLFFDCRIPCVVSSSPTFKMAESNLTSNGPWYPKGTSNRRVTGGFFGVRRWNAPPVSSSVNSSSCGLYMMGSRRGDGGEGLRLRLRFGLSPRPRGVSASSSLSSSEVYGMKSSSSRILESTYPATGFIFPALRRTGRPVFLLYWVIFEGLPSSGLLSCCKKINGGEVDSFGVLEAIFGQCSPFARAAV